MRFFTRRVEGRLRWGREFGRVRSRDHFDQLNLMPESFQSLQKKFNFLSDLLLLS